MSKAGSGKATSASGVRKVRFALGLSLGLNLGLGAGILQSLRPSSIAPAASPMIAPAAPRIVRLVVRTNDTPTVTYVTNQFQWRMLASTNYDEFVARLRAVGCPERTLRDLLLAALEKDYVLRRRALEHQGPFWLAGRDREQAQARQREQLWALRLELTDLARRLLGVEFHPGVNPELADGDELALARLIMGPMSEEAFQGVLGLLRKYTALKEYLEEDCDGVRLQEDRAAFRQLYQRFLQELGTWLSPTQLEEFMARAGVAEDFLNEPDFDGVEITAAEGRQFFLLKAQSLDSLANVLDLDDLHTEAEQEARQAQFQAAVRRLLGEARYADWLRAQEHEFREVFRVTREHHLPKDVAVQVHDIRQLVQKETDRIRNDATLPAETRQRQLAAVSAATRAEVAGLLGARAYEEYLGRGGAWLTNLTRP